MPRVYLPAQPRSKHASNNGQLYKKHSFPFSAIASVTWTGHTFGSRCDRFFLVPGCHISSPLPKLSLSQPVPGPEGAQAPPGCPPVWVSLKALITSELCLQDLLLCFQVAMSSGWACKIWPCRELCGSSLNKEKPGHSPSAGTYVLL